jgi:dTDP-4-dehydrorhamnose reductase
MKIMLTGGRGMLGRTLCAELSDFEVIPTDLPEADITDGKAFDALLKKHRPDAVIHCAAMTAVDKCESEVEQAFLLNKTGSVNVATACNANHIRLIAISTDYVFAGDLDRPYHEDDRADGGRTVYGKSKWAGEEAIRTYCPDHVICRTAWLYGKGGPSFVHTMLSLAAKRFPELKVVADQIGNPTSASAVAHALEQILLRRDLKGTFHVTCEGEASWAEFAAEIFRLTGKNQKIIPCTTEEFPRKAPRPANSRLEKRRLRMEGLAPMPDWKEALAEFFRTEFP